MKTNYDIEAHQGATYLHRFIFQGDGPHGTYNLEGCDIRMHVRRAHAEGEVVLECSLSNERLQVLDAPNGVVRLKLKPEDTKGIRFPKVNAEVADDLDCVYSIEVTDVDGDVHVPVRGKFRLLRAITR